MKKKQFLLFLITITLFSCESGRRNNVAISDINTDFPSPEKLELKPFKIYDVNSYGPCIIDDSVLWHFEETNNHFGTCYNLNTGEKISTIASKGKASYELIQSPNVIFSGDSVQFHTSLTSSNGSIKTFAKKDIINNIPMGERNFSLVTPPQRINIGQMIKLSNGSVLTTICPVNKVFDLNKTETNKKNIVIINDNGIKAYNTINYKSHNIKQSTDYKGPSEVTAKDQIKMSYANGLIATKGCDIAVLTADMQFILYTLDLKNGNVINEKRYTEMQGIFIETTNAMNLAIVDIKSTDKYIFNVVRGYFSIEDKESRTTRESIFVFDWKLNPIKRFDLPNEKGGYYTLSNDCEAVYYCIDGEDGLTLLKANLNL